MLFPGLFRIIILIERARFMKIKLFFHITLCVLLLIGCTACTEVSHSNSQIISEAESSINSEVSEDSAEASAAESENVSDNETATEASDTSDVHAVAIPDDDKIIFNPEKATLFVEGGGLMGFHEVQTDTENYISDYLENNTVPEGYYFYVELCDDANSPRDSINIPEYAKEIGMIVDYNLEHRDNYVIGYITPEVYATLVERDDNVKLYWRHDNRDLVKAE